MESKIKKHYNSDNLTQTIKTALIKSGKDLSALELKDLSPIDQIHTGGAVASINLLKKASLSHNTKILDAGCGIGGSSRLLAHKFGYQVVGIDLADKFIEAATFLTQITGLEKNVIFQQGSILEMPFEDHYFDAVLCQHVLMNIKNKPRAVKEFFRVLKPGGKLIIHEITKGKNDHLIFPVPWAKEPAISFLEPWETLSSFLEKQGFESLFSSDETAAAIALWEKINTIRQTKKPRPNALGLDLVFGGMAKFFGRNMHANFSSNAICLVEAIMQKGYSQ
ncbi:class I SAM-dependent methyltransferase [Desulfobacula sp.]